MKMKNLGRNSLLFIILLARCDSSRIFSGIFPNWGQYRDPPYTFTPTHLQGIIGRLDHLIYAHAHFDPSFQIMFTDTQDKFFVQELVDYKLAHRKLKILLSIGGEDFPSSDFSKMASLNENRARFIRNLQVFVSEHKFDGVDINWQWPCSSPKVIHLKREKEAEDPRQHCTGTAYSMIPDRGSKCPQDAENLLLLLKEMRKALGNSTLLAFTLSHLPQQARNLHLKSVAEYVDYFYIESYGYAISATNDSLITAPNAPLNKPSGTPPVGPQNIKTTVSAYLRAGVPPEKAILGISLHGSVWYAPDAMKWAEFGLQASIQGKCCGPYKTTYGAKYGLGSRRCGLYMSSEIQAVTDMLYYYDKDTQSAIGYLKENSKDGWTEGGTWFSYTDRNSIQAIVQFLKKNSLGGAFVSDVSEDTIDYSNEQFTYELMAAIYSAMQGGGGQGNICNPTVGCNVCTSCCRTYLTNQFDCDACVALKCSVKVCYPLADCDVCAACCSQFFISQSQCNFCVKSKCQ